MLLFMAAMGHQTAKPAQAFFEDVYAIFGVDDELFDGDCDNVQDNDSLGNGTDDGGTITLTVRPSSLSPNDSDDTLAILNGGYGVLICLADVDDNNEVGFDSDGVGTWPFALCGDEDGDTQIFELDDWDDICDNIVGQGTDDMTVVCTADAVDSDCDADESTNDADEGDILAFFVCDTT
jgi:hypothetical protein